MNVVRASATSSARVFKELLNCIKYTDRRVLLISLPGYLLQKQEVGGFFDAFDI